MVYPGVRERTQRVQGVGRMGGRGVSRVRRAQRKGEEAVQQGERKEV